MIYKHCLSFKKIFLSLNSFIRIENKKSSSGNSIFALIQELILDSKSLKLKLISLGGFEVVINKDPEFTKISLKNWKKRFSFKYSILSKSSKINDLPDFASFKFKLLNLLINLASVISL